MVIIILLSLRPVLIVVDRERCYTHSPTGWSATGLKLLFNIYRKPLGDVIYQFGVKSHQCTLSLLNATNLHK